MSNTGFSPTKERPLNINKSAPLKAIEIANVTEEQLEKHYNRTVVSRIAFDKVRPNYYEVKSENKNPMINHYKQWLLQQGFLYIVIPN